MAFIAHVLIMSSWLTPTGFITGIRVLVWILHIVFNPGAGHLGPSISSYPGGPIGVVMFFLPDTLFFSLFFFFRDTVWTRAAKRKFIVATFIVGHWRMTWEEGEKRSDCSFFSAFPGSWGKLSDNFRRRNIGLDLRSLVETCWIATVFNILTGKREPFQWVFVCPESPTELKERSSFKTDTQ